MEVKESIIFYKSFFEAIKELPPENQIEVYNAIFQKYFYDNDINLSGISKGIVALIIPNIDSANKRYFANIQNGKKGGRPKANENPTITQIKPNNNLNVNDNVNDNVNVNKLKENIKEKKQFKKPTLEELEEYKKEINGTVDVQHFIDYYESNGWLVGKNHMKDWKATYRNWNRKQQPIKSNEIIPEWVGKEIEEKEANEEQILEMERMLSKYR